jgi:hypothetical protein
MRTLSNNTRPLSDSDSSGSDESFDYLTEWQTDVFEDFRQDNLNHNNDWSGLKPHQIIQLANEKVTLKSIIEKYNIDFIENYSPSGWTHKCSCPFPDHNDSSPSFSYNTEEDRFNCFGCNRGGKAVQFKSFMEKRKPLNVAIELLENIISSDSAYTEVQDSPNEKVDPLLKEVSDLIREFIQSNKSPEAIDFAMNLTQFIDVCLFKNSVNIDISAINGAINIIKRKIKNYNKR